MGVKAVQILFEGKGNRIVAMQQGKIVDFDITEALNMKRDFDVDLYNAALQVSI